MKSLAYFLLISVQIKKCLSSEQVHCVTDMWGWWELSELHLNDVSDYASETMIYFDLFPFL